nr:SdpI family protein [Candidatus Woesearchaeota archaeon]
MGKKETLEELDKQLKSAQKTKRSASYWMITGVVTIFLALIFPLLWIFVIVAFIMVMVNYIPASRRINEINIEKAKLK